MQARINGRDTPAQPSAPRSVVRLLGAPIDPLRLPELLRFVQEQVQRRVRTTVLYVNVHCMNVYARDPGYRQIIEAADRVYCDGTGVRLATWIARDPLPERMTGADWIDRLADLAARRGMRLYLLGGVPNTARRAAEVLTARYPGLTIVGTASGYGAGDEEVRAINEARPDILLVGMGTPTQEKWIAAHRDALDVPVVWAVGALFDFVSGKIPRGPRWMTEHGLEWVCRLAVEPRKLWRRYLIGNPQFLIRVLRTYLPAYF